MAAIFGFLAKIMAYPMRWIYTVVNNYGIAIILMTIIIRLCLLPLYKKQLKYTARMNELQPKIKEIQTRYANDRQRMNEEMSKLYGDSNMSTLSGCLPLLIQMPIILGLYYLLREPLQYMTQSYMIAAVHESFLWVQDLSQPDSWIFPILAGITTYLTTASTAQADTTGMTAGMKFLSPIMIFLFGRSFPAGLSLYWTIGNLCMLAQTYYFNKTNKKNKLVAEAEKEALKNKRKEQNSKN